MMTTTGSTKQSYLYKLVSYQWNGKSELGFVLEEAKTYSGSWVYTVLNQRTTTQHILYSSYTKVVLEE
jgi:hypothetical protein